VLDSYFARKEKAAARDSSTTSANRTPMKKNVLIGFTRDTAKALTKLGILVPQELTLSLDEIDANALEAKLKELASVLGDCMQMVAEAKGDAEGMQAKMADMMTVQEAAAQVEEMKAKLAEAEKMLAEAQKAEGAAAKAADDLTAAKKMCDELVAELAPYKAAEFKQLCADAIAAGYEANAVNDCKDAAALRRHVVLTHPKLGEAKYGKASDDVIAAAFDGVWAARPAAALVQPAPAPRPTADAGRTSTLSGVPQVQIQHAADSNGAPAKVSIVDEMDG
jgi:hypothetical protein